MQHSSTTHTISQDSTTAHHAHSAALQSSQMDFVSSMILQLLESVDKELKDAFITIKHSLENADSATLTQTLSHISSQDKTLSIIKAFTLYHMLLNIIEELNLSDSATLNALPQTLLDLKNEGYDKQDILKVLQNIAFYPVFTAHPTESRRRTFLEAHHKMSKNIRDIFTHNDSQARFELLYRLNLL